jgi:hypothetical protein
MGICNSDTADLWGVELESIEHGWVAIEKSS